MHKFHHIGVGGWNNLAHILLQDIGDIASRQQRHIGIDIQSACLALHLSRQIGISPAEQLRFSYLLAIDELHALASHFQVDVGICQVSDVNQPVNREWLVVAAAQRIVVESYNARVDRDDGVREQNLRTKHRHIYGTVFGSHLSGENRFLKTAGHTHLAIQVALQFGNSVRDERRHR